MRRSYWLAGAVAALILLGEGTVASARGGISSDARAVTTTRHMITSGNAHRLAAVTALFSGSAVVRVAKQEWHGRRAIETWWRAQFSGGLRISALSSFRVRGTIVTGVLRWTTRAGACTSGCTEQVNWWIQGSRIDRMSMKPLPIPNKPAPPVTVPPAPRSPPPPGVTPTIPT